LLYGVLQDSAHQLLFAFLQAVGEFLQNFKRYIFIGTRHDRLLPPGNKKSLTVIENFRDFIGRCRQNLKAELSGDMVSTGSAGPKNTNLDSEPEVQQPIDHHSPRENSTSTLRQRCR
jgi:hypothetical protein